MSTKHFFTFLSLLLMFVEVNAICDPYEKPIVNLIGEVKCIPNPGSCNGTEDYVDDDKTCDERGPCFDFRICYYKYLRTTCLPDACNRCKPRIYDHLFREVCIDEY